ncbi:MAG: hypothetical protein KKG93_06380 [Bacteroidetes bacterium]|nr:hypothetical protein [Bacteroidota bacterium]
MKLNGIALYGFYNGFDYKVSIMEGLNSDKFSAKSAIRDARQKGYKANANKLLYSARVDYTSIPGFKIGVSFTYNKSNGKASEIPVNIFELHATMNKNNFIAAAEYGAISFENYEVKNSSGYYVDLGYDLGTALNQDIKVIPFIRYSDLNTASSTKSGGNSEKQYHLTQWKMGLSLLLIDQVVFKIDCGQDTIELNNVRTNSFNLGAGYYF